MLRLSYPLVVPDGSTCSLILMGTVMTGDCGMEAGGLWNGNYEFQFYLFLLVVEISPAMAIVLPFRQ